MINIYLPVHSSLIFNIKNAGGRTAFHISVSWEVTLVAGHTCDSSYSKYCFFHIEEPFDVEKLEGRNTAGDLGLSKVMLEFMSFSFTSIFLHSWGCVVSFWCFVQMC